MAEMEETRQTQSIQMTIFILPAAEAVMDVTVEMDMLDMTAPIFSEALAAAAAMDVTVKMGSLAAAEAVDALISEQQAEMDTFNLALYSMGNLEKAESALYS